MGYWKCEAIGTSGATAVMKSDTVRKPFEKTALAEPAKWHLGDDTLIQKVSFAMYDDEWHEEITELISGTEASMEIATWLSDPPIEEFAPLSDERGIYGFAFRDCMEGLNKVEYWDCDEETYSEYAAENE